MLSCAACCYVFGLVSVCLLAAVAPVGAQGVQAGTVSGVVQSVDTLPLPGVTVTVTSPNLQGERFAVSDENGVYYLRGLLPGTYQRHLRHPGLSARDARGRPGRRRRPWRSSTRRCRWPGVTETVTVTAEAPSPMAAPKIEPGLHEGRD